MKKGLICSFALFFVLVFSNTALYAQEKIGSVDVAKIFDEYNKTKEYSKGLEEEASSYEKERDVKVSEIKQLQDKLGLLSEGEKEKKQKELEGLVKDVRDYAIAKETDLKKEGDDKLKEIARDIESAVAEFAKKEGYTMVFNEKVFVYYNKSNDITDKVLGILQADYKKEKGKKK